MRWFWLLVWIGSPVVLAAQNEYVIVDSLQITGNKKTKGPIIFRELTFQAGDTIRLQSLLNEIDQSRRNLMNTQLFSQAELSIKAWDPDNKLVVQITVVEAWFLFPAPIFELADRNFNVWWTEEGRSLDRINIGGRLKYLNPTGHADELKASAQFGYTQKYDLDYRFPYLDRKKRLGVFAGVLFAENNEVAYNTINNKLLFHNEDGIDLTQRFRIKAGATYRKSFYAFHQFQAEYHINRVDSFVVEELNSDYFGNGQTVQRYPVLEYLFRYDRRDFNLYPRQGYAFRAKVRQIGLSSQDLSQTELRAEWYQIFSILDRSAISIATLNQITLTRNRIVYNLSQAHGFGDDYLRGYEFYVIQAKDFTINKIKGKWSLWNHLIKLDKWMPLTALRRMPIELFLTTNIDFGYFRDPYYNDFSTMSNQWLVGYGIGLDLMLYNNYVYTIEYSINQFNEKGIFLHFNVGL